MAGRLTLFAHESDQYGEEPSWNTDPLTGTHAPLSFGKTLDYRDESIVGDIKYLWEPNRHYHLVTLAQAYALSGDEKYARRLRAHVESWIEQCPYGLGPNWCSALEVSIRLINWWIAWRLIGGLGSALFVGESGAALLDRWLSCIRQHVTFIDGYYSGYSSANNHLIGEASGAFIGSICWPFWKDFNRIAENAKDILVRECLRQNSDDGVNLEQAIWYQQFVLDFLILAGTCAPDSAERFPPQYWDRIQAMLEFLSAMTDTAGNVPMFGDADDGYVCRLAQPVQHEKYGSLLSFGAAMFGRPELCRSNSTTDEVGLWYSALLYPPILSQVSPKRPSGIPREFPSGGYYILGTSDTWGRRPKVVVKAGPLGYGSLAAHGHADALSVYLSVDGNEILVDPGTYAYHTNREWRDYFRGTSAHNTIRIDGEDQSVSGGNFMWVEHAKAWCNALSSTEAFDECSVEHDGYARLPDPVRHRRVIRLQKRDSIVEITDELDGGADHVAEMHYHFAESCNARLDGNVCLIDTGSITVRLEIDGPVADLFLTYGDEERPLGWISRSFDSKVPSWTLTWRYEGPLPIRAFTRITL